MECEICINNKLIFSFQVTANTSPVHCKDKQINAVLEIIGVCCENRTVCSRKAQTLNITVCFVHIQNSMLKV